MKKEVVDAVTVNLTQSVPQSPSPQENCTDSQNPSQFNMNFGGRSNQSRGRGYHGGNIYLLTLLPLYTLNPLNLFFVTCGALLLLHPRVCLPTF